MKYQKLFVATEYIRTELESVQNEVSTKAGPGRITQGAVSGLLARLHLNIVVWREPYARNLILSRKI